MVWTVWPLSPSYNHHWSPVSPCRADLIDSTDPTWPVVVSDLRTYFVVNTTSDVRYLVCSLFLFLLLCFWYEHRRFCSIEKVMEEMVFSCLKNTFLHHINCETKWPERKRKDRKLRLKRVWVYLRLAVSGDDEDECRVSPMSSVTRLCLCILSFDIYSMNVR